MVKNLAVSSETRGQSHANLVLCFISLHSFWNWLCYVLGFYASDVELQEFNPRIFNTFFAIAERKKGVLIASTKEVKNSQASGNLAVCIRKN